MSSIDLGFTQHIDNSWKLKNKYFPSKIGGKPVFLELKTLPMASDMRCAKCDQMLAFLLQIYAPIESKDTAFHRTLFLFCCLNDDCNCFRVLRSQLPRINDCYSADPPDYRFDDPSYDPKPQHFGHQLCVVCGLEAKKKCSKCLKANYCSKEHQIIDWKEGRHKQMCGSTADPTINSGNSLLFPEYELIMGDNECSDDTDSDNRSNDSESERREMKTYEEFIDKNRSEYQTKNLDKYEDTETEEQKVFNKFKQLSGEEVIRYCSYDESGERAEPLWISVANRPALPVPKCQNCNNERRFEFQVMPHLLSKIVTSEHSLDWGTLVVYTCSQSCSPTLDVHYMEEFIWRQNIC